jgi:hypothetical protein
MESRYLGNARAAIYYSLSDAILSIRMAVNERQNWEAFAVADAITGVAGKLAAMLGAIHL